MQLSASYTFLLSFLLLPFGGFCQNLDSLNQSLSDDPSYLLEDILSNLETEVDFDFNTFYEQLEIYKENPLNLNTASIEDLQELRILSDLQIDRFIAYRQKAGNLIALYELQAIPGFDPAFIKALLPYVRLEGNLDDYNLSIPKMLVQGKNELFLRWSRTLEQERGFSPPTETSTTRFLGDPNRLYLRFKHSYENKLSYGITAEKDPGEEFFRGNNQKGFDFYSAHLFLRDYRKWLKGLAIGDYTVRFGQGLILFGGFGYGKSPFTMDINRSGRALSAFTSVNEASFFRGTAINAKFGEHLEVTAFGSYRQRDGNLVVAEVDSLEQTETETPTLTLSSIFNSGFHRTQSEIDDRNALTQWTSGLSLKWLGENFHIAANGVYDRFDKQILRTPQPYNQFSFQGQELLNLSLDYNFRIRNIRWIGVTAYRQDGAWDTLNGLLIGLDRNLDLSVLHRAYARDFQTVHGNPFGETSGGRNERGLYLGLEARPNKHWRINGYLDFWAHPFLRFNVDAPSRGNDWLLRITYLQKRRLEVYWQVRGETKQGNLPGNETKSDFLVDRETFLSRLQFSYKLSKAVELRTRWSLGWTYLEGREAGEPLTGSMIYQDIIFKPIGIPWSFTTRFALFDTDGFDVRFYAFENDLLYTFSIPAYYNTGSRFYFNLRYRGIRNLTLEARFAQTFFRGFESVGSGLNEVEGPVRSQVKAQIKYQF